MVTMIIPWSLMKVCINAQMKNTHVTTCLLWRKIYGYYAAQAGANPFIPIQPPSMAQLHWWKDCLRFSVRYYTTTSRWVGALALIRKGAPSAIMPMVILEILMFVVSGVRRRYVCVSRQWWEKEVWGRISVGVEGREGDKEATRKAQLATRRSGPGWSEQWKYDIRIFLSELDELMTLWVK